MLISFSPDFLTAIGLKLVPGIFVSDLLDFLAGVGLKLAHRIFCLIY